MLSTKTCRRAHRWRITVRSTDHTDMGRTAARMILGSPWQKIKNPFTLIRRNLYKRLASSGLGNCHPNSQ
jgi:hypothetical protein